tara:strand:+ start:53 stop:775 length:723 start_codon:yes stop_codon:yes gene_type:complete
MFDQLTIEKLEYYVYALINPNDKRPFYIGKGIGNRVFNHKECAIKDNESNLKLDTIREIIKSGVEVEHLIIRHGLSEKESFEIEASLIDFGNKFGFEFSNLVLGHHSDGKGLMTTDEIIRIYNAKLLEELSDPIIIININKKYSRGNSSQEIYEATKGAWVVGEEKRKETKYALSEYSGIVIEVFEIKEWYNIKTTDNKRNNRWGFNGEIANPEIRDKYLNKSIAHTKKKGAANPIKYRL